MCNPNSDKPSHPVCPGTILYSCAYVILCVSACTCRNEALNGMRMQELLDASEFSSADVVIPVSYMGLTTR